MGSKSTTAVLGEYLWANLGVMKDKSPSIYKKLSAYYLHFFVINLGVNNGLLKSLHPVRPCELRIRFERVLALFSEDLECYIAVWLRLG